MPDFGLEGASSTLAEIMSIDNKYVQVVFCTNVPNPDTTNKGSGGRVLQPAGYNAMYACWPPAEQEATVRWAVLSIRGCFFIGPCDL